ncbi:MAG TPA: Hpt domain-containing protein [Oscillatoriaceae cyanobacterium M33_DOE_052]|nr:Hpt domain-containing protein [Oscillatoriaceae cyanobacterium M33_DOE_052]
MSTDESNSTFFAEFLDDYFAESDAHMTNARRNLLALESYVDSDVVELGLVEELLRSFHTLKGLSGMVGVREAEALAHEMESYLRTLREEKARLSSEGMDALMAGAQMLQQAIAARKEQSPPPNIEATIARLQAILPPSEEPPLQTAHMEETPAEVEKPVGSTSPENGRKLPQPITPSPPPPAQAQEPNPVRGSTADPSVPPSIVLNNVEKEKLHQARAQSKALWHFQFAPNTELANQGINVNTIRTHLQELGEIIHASPRMVSGGGIVFDFILSQVEAETQTDFDPTAKEIISQSGLTYSPFEEGLGDGGTGGRGDGLTAPLLPCTPAPLLLCTPAPPLPPAPGGATCHQDKNESSEQCSCIVFEDAIGRN